MHVLFLHQNFPAQFGPIATHLVRQRGDRVTFVSNQSAGKIAGVEHILYPLAGGATERTHYAARTFENLVWHSHGVYDALKVRPNIKPDLVVAHAGFLSAVAVRELYACPVINYFEY